MQEAVRVRLEKQPKLCKNCIAANRQTDKKDKTEKEKRDKTDKDKITNCNHPKVAILFSGGLDSAVLAAMSNNFVPLSEPIDLLNVAFEKPRPPPDAKFLRRWDMAPAATT